MAIQLNSEQVTECSNKEPATSPPLVSVVMPCLNEARTVAGCIREALAGLASGNLAGEIIIADNGSTDESVEIAIAEDARVVHVAEKGYGSALRGGFAAARGKYIVMGDADGSYDFGEIPRFVAKLEEGYDLVMGNRFAGGIEKGAMPWHHRYIGNPLLSGIGRLLYRTPCRDWHCGLRAFDREKAGNLKLKSPGMEFASELVIAASGSKFRIVEVSTKLRPDGRGRPPHLQSIRDGMRHLKLLTLGKLIRAIELTMLLFCVVLCLFSGWAACLSTLGMKETVLLIAKPSNLKFNDIKGELSVDIANISKEEIVIRAIHTSCQCTVPGDHPKSLKPGEKFRLSIAYERSSKTTSKYQFVYVNYCSTESEGFHRHLEIRIEANQHEAFL